MTADTVTREDVQIHTGTSAARMAHVIDQRPASGQDTTTAYVEGSELVALCGYRWVPGHSPAGLPVCPECQRIIDSLGRSYEL